MTDAELDGAVSETRSELNRVSARLDELSERLTEARMTPREGRTQRVESAQREYNEGSEIFNQLRDRLSALEDEQIRRRREAQAARPAPVRTFVNSYDEATRRNITSLSYERAQRRLERELLSWLGR